MEISTELLNEIADNLEMGFRCFLNKKSPAIITYPNEDNSLNFEPEMWTSEISAVKEAKKDIIEIENLTPSDSFKIVEEFILTVEDPDFQKTLSDSIQIRKPFANFKFLIESSNTERNRWFDFKKQWYIEWVKNQISFL